MFINNAFLFCHHPPPLKKNCPILGLKIPDGGVHIVGGDDGDAFIAFASDEDARQAMMMTGKEIHEKPVTLLLSSKVEMSRVIADAR